ncbi:MAG: ribonuclease P protein component [Bacteroidales bacterium]|nr:ribonuclease P protein component [Bacteroidales bacterium]
MQPVEDRFFLTQQERLKSSLSIKMVMDEKNVASAFPLKCFYRLASDSENPSQMAVIVSKRRFKHAVDRNRVKRLVREAYRLQKNKLLTDKQTFQLCWMFVGKELPDYALVYESVNKIINKINSCIREDKQ